MNVNWQAFASVFVTIFLAEVGDKTQLATVLFAADGKTSRWLVFVAAASALVLAAGIGVLHHAHGEADGIARADLHG